MSGLILKNVRKSFGRQTVISDISLAVHTCELLVLLGPSGCGKSTLLRLIAGLEEADSGEIYIGGKRVDDRRPKERNVALVFQNYSLYPHMTVAGNLAFPLIAAGYKKAAISRRVREVAEMIGLYERLKDKPSQLSGGQRQRVALGRAIVRQPAVFLLDEPLSNLDTELRIRMRREIVALHRRLQRATIHVTHDQTEALSMADRIAIMNDGKIIQIGSPGELYDDPNCAFVAQFLGHPKTSLLTTNLQGNRLMPFELPIDRLKCSKMPSKVSLALRPEWIEIGEKGDYLAEVVHCEFLGDQYAVTLGFGGYHLAASHVRRPPQIGEHVRFGFDPAKILLFDPQSGDRLR